ncbi:MAG: LuxR C-terminal-related transcriptional regulator [Oscillospiraceae bacterium]|nr:LuxR C-terminal-related transcriptional regulator [Oscillospiraceae bacterium]MCL2248337.1 LuxR C-terminal-related transcriptional regulator [Oscillospiraceae bacterium]
MKTSTGTNLSTSPLRKYLMPRPRVNEILGRASCCKLVYVVAGAGYGKTAAVQNYIRQQKDAVVRWVQLTESDNIGTHYWENLTHTVSLDNPKLAREFRELGFPETLVRFKQFAETIKLMEHSTHKTFLVLDDFHLVNSKQALTFAERCTQLAIPGACVIIISRAEPDINTMSLLSKGEAAVLTEDDLRFTTDEIKGFLEHSNIICTLENAEKFAESTKGWPIAVNLLSLVLKKSRESIDTALELTTKNISKLFESEAWSVFPESIQKTLVKLSLVADLTLPLSHEIFSNETLDKYMRELASFISYDSFCNNYRIHPLYLKFLDGKQNLLTKREKRAIYRRAAKWCFENGFFTGTVKYYAASHEYEQIIDVLRSYPGKLPHGTYKYFLDLIAKLEPGKSYEENLKLERLSALAEPFLLIGMREFDTAHKLTETVISEWEQSDSPYKSEVLLNAYNALAHISKYTCITTHRYKTALYLEKSASFAEKLGQKAEDRGIFALQDIRSFACLVGECGTLSNLKEFEESTKEPTTRTNMVSLRRYNGYDDGASCEIEFFKNKLGKAAHYAHRGLMKARQNAHYGIEMMIRQYMLRIAIHMGDYSLSNEILSQIFECIENEGKFNKQLLYDLIIGSFYIQIGAFDMVAPWIFSEHDKDEATDFRVPMRELIVSVRYFIGCKKYNHALTLLSNSYPRLPHERFLFSELVLTLLLSVARIKTGDTDGAVESFEKAYKLSFSGVLEMPFIELGKGIVPIAAAVKKSKTGLIPEKWLHATERKAGIYAKNTLAIGGAYKFEHQIEEKISLTAREREVLGDMSRGLSREEIAELRHLSINTIKKNVQSIYIKLNATNNLDAIRIAVEQKLL